jgi:hypothetical protein
MLLVRSSVYSTGGAPTVAEVEEVAPLQLLGLLLQEAGFLGTTETATEATAGRLTVHGSAVDVAQVPDLGAVAVHSPAPRYPPAVRRQFPGIP